MDTIGNTRGVHTDQATDSAMKPSEKMGGSPVRGRDADAGLPRQGYQDGGGPRQGYQNTWVIARCVAGRNLQDLEGVRSRDLAKAWSVSTPLVCRINSSSIPYSVSTSLVFRILQYSGILIP